MAALFGSIAGAPTTGTFNGLVSANGRDTVTAAAATVAPAWAVSGPGPATASATVTTMPASLNTSHPFPPGCGHAQPKPRDPEYLIGDETVSTPVTALLDQPPRSARNAAANRFGAFASQASVMSSLRSSPRIASSRTSTAA